MNLFLAILIICVVVVIVTYILDDWVNRWGDSLYDRERNHVIDEMYKKQSQERAAREALEREAEEKQSKLF